MADDQKFAAPLTANSPNTEDNIPPEGDSKVAEYLYHKFLIAKNEKNRLQMHPKWHRNYEIKRGRHWKVQNSKYPLVPVNLAFMVISRTKAHLTDSKPMFEIIAHDEDARNQAPVMQCAAEAWWKRTEQQKKHSDSIDNGETYGSTIENMHFDPSLEGGIGDVDNKVVDPFKFFPWPGVMKIQKMPFFFEGDVMELRDIRRTWPETGMRVTADKEWSVLFGKGREDIKAGTLNSHQAVSNLPNNYARSDGSSTSLGIERAMVIKCWMRDYTMEPVYEDQPMMGEFMDDEPESPTFGQIILGPTGETEKVQVGERAKYPGFIRVVHIANEGKVVLDDLPNPSINPTLPREVTMNHYLFDKFPYIKTDSNTDTSNFWAFSIIEQIEIMIKEINKKISQIAAYIDKTVRPPLIIPNNLGIQDHHVSNLPGQKWWPNNPVMSQYIRYLQVPSLPSDFYNYLELLLRLVDIITGIHDVTEGRKPKGISAASAIVALQEKAQTMFREKIRHYDLALEEKGRMFISLVQNWYTEERKLTLAGKAAQKFDSNFLPYRGSELQGEMTYEVVPGSTMPKSQFARRDQALALYQGGAIDQRAILEDFNYPNLDEVINRMEQGQINIFLQKLEIAGIDPKTIQAIQFISSLDDKEFKKLFMEAPQQSGGQSSGEPKTQPGGEKK